MYAGTGCEVGAAADKLQRKIESLIERACKALILEINRELRKSGTGTPVDTGHARASWIPAVGAPNLVEPVGTSSGLAQAGAAQVMSYRRAQGTLYLSNVAPYIRRLNAGHSQQAPAMFVELAIARGIQTIKSKLGVDFGLDSFIADSGSSAAENMASAFSPFGD
jgi:hypothetical protein